MSEYFDAICVKCGKATLWEDELGDRPLCFDCWEAKVDIEEKFRAWGCAWRRKHYEAHRGENRAGCRRYRLNHRQELNEYHRRYCSGRRELIAQRQREFYQVNREAELARASRYRQEKSRAVLQVVDFTLDKR